MISSPYVVGQWVRGQKFYGRTSLIQEIIEGPRSWLWLLGTRRIGKTSVLKQVEWLAAKSPEKTYFPVFWDFQGADTVDELNLSFGDALLDFLRSQPGVQRAKGHVFANRGTKQLIVGILKQEPHPLPNAGKMFRRHCPTADANGAAWPYLAKRNVYVSGPKILPMLAMLLMPAAI